MSMTVNPILAEMLEDVSMVSIAIHADVFLGILVPSAQRVSYLICGCSEEQLTQMVLFSLGASFMLISASLPKFK